MGCAVPVIVSDVGILAEVVGNASLVFKPGDADMLRERLLRWLSHPDASAAEGRRLREITVERYGPQPSVDRYEEHLQKLAAARGNRKA
jgi:glycosyltransferase involved in cell wall biosynthesis